MSVTDDTAQPAPAPAPLPRPVPLFRPSKRQFTVLAAIALAAAGCGFYLRDRVLGDVAVAAACTGAERSWICTVRDATADAIAPSAFGFAALISALLGVWRPSLALCALALISGGLGIMLYNVGLSALAVAVLTLSLARPSGAPA